MCDVVLSSTGDDTLSNTITELRARVNGSDRKYVIWADATVYCGIAQVGGGDTAGLPNSSTGPALRPCRQRLLGFSDHLSEVHELMHTLGAVHQSAQYTGGYHCTDEYGPDVLSRRERCDDDTDCPSAHKWLLDCNHDDYFHTWPSTGHSSTLTERRNEVFLVGGTTRALRHLACPNDDDHHPQRLDLVETLQEDVRPHGRRRLGRERASVRVQRWRRQGQRRRRRWRWNPNPAPASDRRQGSTMIDGSGPAAAVTSTLPAGTYTWEVTGTSSVSFTLTVTHTRHHDRAEGELRAGLCRPSTGRGYAQQPPLLLYLSSAFLSEIARAR